MKIIIPGEVIVKKNSQIPVRMGKRTVIMPSNKYMKYEKQSVASIGWQAAWEGGYPCIVEMFFYRKTKRKFDLDNLQSSVLDILVKANQIEDDSMNFVIPRIKGFGWGLDKDNPRAEVLITKYCP